MTRTAQKKREPIEAHRSFKRTHHLPVLGDVNVKIVLAHPGATCVICL